jgi:membrane protease YdiL (CAAX protease family)
MTANHMITEKGNTKQKNLTIIAWSIIALMSVPQIILYETGWELPPGPFGLSLLGWIRVILLAGMWLLSLFWSEIKPLGGFFLAFLAFWVAEMFLEPLIFERDAWTNLLERSSTGMYLLLDTIQQRVLLISMVALTLVGSGIGLQKLYLVWGNPKAPASPTRLLQGNKTVPWNKVVWGWLPIYIVIVLLIVWFQVRPTFTQVSQAFVFIPALFLAAVLNAFGEEFIFRSVMLARLEPAVGSQQAIWMAAGLFGFMHYFGYPNGIPGLLLAAYLGWLAAKSMVETGGFVWAMLIHIIGDFLLYFFMAML